MERRGGQRKSARVVFGPLMLQTIILAALLNFLLVGFIENFREIG